MMPMRYTSPVVIWLNILTRIHATATFEHADVTFNVTLFGHCPPILSGFRVFVDKQLPSCVYECTLYQRCRGVAFRRDYLTCELYDVDDTSFMNGYQASSCVYVKRADMVTESAESEPTCFGCSDEEVCNVSNKTCAIFECPPMEYHKGTLRGNIDEVGAQKGVKCIPRYMEVYDVISVTCQPTGKWDYSPFCYRRENSDGPNGIPYIYKYLPMSIVVVQDQHFRRSIPRAMSLGEECFPSWLVYNVQLCEDTRATCIQSTVATPHYCTCPAIYYDTSGPAMGGACKLKIATSQPCTYNTATDSVNIDMCVDIKAKCQTSTSSSTGFACLCLTGYFLGSNGICQKIVPMGDACQRDEQCYISYSQCSVTCQCIQGYRYMNGACERYSCPSTNVWLFQPGTSFAIKFSSSQTSTLASANFDCLTSGGRGVVILDQLWKMNMIRQLLIYCPDYSYTEFWVDGFMTSLSLTSWYFSTGHKMSMTSDYWRDETFTTTRQCVVLKGPSWKFSTEDCFWPNGYICEL